MKLAVGCDHTGIDLKKRIFEHLEKRGISYQDFGTTLEERADYPLIGEAVAAAVVRGEYDGGVLICGTGIGISISANKVPGIRAVVCSEPYSALLAKQHNNCNILAMGARVVGQELAVMILDAWLDGKHEGGRHQMRVDLISEIERKYSNGRRRD